MSDNSTQVVWRHIYATTMSPRLSRPERDFIGLSDPPPADGAAMSFLRPYKSKIYGPMGCRQRFLGKWPWMASETAYFPDCADEFAAMYANGDVPNSAKPG